MKKLLFILLLSKAVLNVNAQVVFCPPGAQWTNLFEYPFPVEQSYSKIVYIGDSTIGAESYKVLRHHNFYLTGCDAPYTLPYKPHTLIKQRGDTVFMRSSYTQHNWQILYNFAAVTGNMWVDSLGAPNSKIYYTTFVDSVNYVTINNFQLKQLHVRVNCNGYGFNTAITQTGTITERIGFSGHLFPYFNPNVSGICHGAFFINRLCYGDDAFGVQQFSNAGCYFTGLQEAIQNPYELALFPNPAHTFFEFKKPVRRVWRNYLRNF